MSILPLRPLGFGEIVDGAVQLYRRDFVLFYLIALVATLPGYLLQLFLAPDFGALVNAPDDPAQMAGWMGEIASVAVIAMFVALGSIVFAWFGSVALTVAIRERTGEREVSLGGALRSALPYFPAALGAGSLVLLGFVVVAVATSVITSLLLGALAASGVLTAIVAMTVLVPIAALVFLTWMGVTFGILPAVVFEGRGATAAFGRSISLCRGGLLRVIGVVAVAMIIQMAPSFGIGILFGLDNFFADPEAATTIGATEQWLSNTVDFVVGALTMPFAVGAMVVLFHDRRVRSEGFDLAARAEAMRPDNPMGR